MIGRLAWNRAKDLFPICRSLTGAGTLQTLEHIQKILPDLVIHSVPSGTKAFDWTVPDEWNITDGFLHNIEKGFIADFKKNNLHIVGYSERIVKNMDYAELEPHLHSIPSLPDAIPYVTSYYKRDWGFCITENQRKKIRKFRSSFLVNIKSHLAPGRLNYGELIIFGKEKKEILLSTYICHPSMANNELSGIVITTALAEMIQKLDNRYTYRILFLPETIGSIVYLSKYIEHLQRYLIAGFVVTCVGDNRAFSYMPSKYGNTLADRAAKEVLRNIPHKQYSYLDRGSDERQYCSAGLPVCSIMRSKYGTYPEYHTSLDNMDLISPEGLQGAYEVLSNAIEVLENNRILEATYPCEPQLGKHGLQSTISKNGISSSTKLVRDILTYADKSNDLLEIAEYCKIPFLDCLETVRVLKEKGLLLEVH